MEVRNNVQKTENCTKEQEQKSSIDENDKTTSMFLYFTATIVNLNYLTLGVTVVWISPVTSKLLSYNSEENPLGRPVTTLELSLIGCLPQVGMVIGPLLLEKLFDQFGRKRTLNGLALIIAACFVTLAFSKSIWLYYVMLLLIGIMLGATCVGLSMYTSEITEDHNRGKFSCYTGLFLPLGNLYGFLLGPFLSVRNFTLLCSLPSFLTLIISEALLPESPQYFINKSKQEDALKSIRKLLGKHQSRAETVVNKLEQNLSQLHKISTNSYRVIFTDKSSRNGLIICCVLSSMSAGTGITCIMSYLQPIFEASGTEISSSLCTIVVGIVQIICYLTAAILVENWGRRPLSLFSSLSSVIPLTIIGAYFYLISIHSLLVETLKWVPIAGILLLIITAITGVCSTAMALLNEVFTSEVKSSAISIVYFVSGILVAAFVFVFPILMDSVGLAWSFWMFALLSSLGFLFMYFWLPETKGKSILEIQELLSKF